MHKYKITSFSIGTINKLITKKIALLALTVSLSISVIANSYENFKGYEDTETSTTDNLAKRLGERTDFSDMDILSLDYNIKNLDLTYARFLSDISSLPEECPYLEELNLDYCSSLTDLSFLYRMNNLKKVSLKAVACVDDELVEYLNDNNIKHNITDDDLLILKELDIIIENLITDDMTDEDKIKTIISYVISNYEYDKNLIYDSYYDPLVGMLNTKKGVCSRFSYLTNVLLRKAGIESFEVRSVEHVWNLVKLYDRYYYIDPTNITMDVPPFISIPLLNKANIGIHYLTNPGVNFLEHTENYDDSSLVSMPDNLVEDIKSDWDNVGLYEKYGRTVPARLIEALSVIVGCCGLSNVLVKKRKRKIKTPK